VGLQRHEGVYLCVREAGDPIPLASLRLAPGPPKAVDPWTPGRLVLDVVREPWSCRLGDICTAKWARAELRQHG